MLEKEKRRKESSLKKQAAIQSARPGQQALELESCQPRTSLDAPATPDLTSLSSDPSQGRSNHDLENRNLLK